MVAGVRSAPASSSPSGGGGGTKRGRSGDGGEARASRAPGGAATRAMPQRAVTRRPSPVLPRWPLPLLELVGDARACAGDASERGRAHADAARMIVEGGWRSVSARSGKRQRSDRAYHGSEET